MPRAPHPPPDYISKATAADLLDCSLRTIDRMLAEGTLTRYRTRGGVRVDRHELHRVANASGR